MTTRVTVFDDSLGTVCPGRCGSLAAVEEAFEFARKHLALRYGSSVTVEWCDLAQEEARKREAAIVEQIRVHQLSLPLVAVDGAIRLCGNVEYRAIAEAIEAGREVGRWQTGTTS